MTNRIRLTTNTIALRSVDKQLANLGGGSTGVVDNSEVLRLRDEMNAANTAYLNSGSTDQSLLNKYNSLKLQYQDKIKSVGNVSSGGSGSFTDKANLLQKKSELEVSIEAEKVHTCFTSVQNKSTTRQCKQPGKQKRSSESLTKDADLSDKEYLDLLKKYNDAVDQSKCSGK
jgi:hypothetical protein